MTKEVNSFKLERRLFTLEDTVNLPDITGKIVVLEPDCLAERYKNPENQLVLAQSGFGCEGGIGSAVFGIALADGQHARWERRDFIGVLKDSETIPAINMQLIKVEALSAGETLSAITLPLPAYDVLKAKRENKQVLTPREQFAVLFYDEKGNALSALKRFIAGMRMAYSFGQLPEVKNPEAHIHALQSVATEAAELIGIDTDLLMLLSSVGFEYGTLNVMSNPAQYNLRKGKVR